jgi:hypothetical protein
MSTDFTIEFRLTYLHIQNAPNYEITSSGASRRWAALATACAAFGCNRVLWEGKVAARRLTISEVYDSAKQLSDIAPGLKLACFFEGYTPDELSDFYKKVALNRGTLIRFFSNRVDALRWLGVDLGPSVNHQLTA